MHLHLVPKIHLQKLMLKIHLQPYRLYVHKFIGCSIICNCKIVKQCKCSYIGDVLNKLNFIHRMKHYSVLKEIGMISVKLLRGIPRTQFVSEIRDYKKLYIVLYLLCGKKKQENYVNYVYNYVIYVNLCVCVRISLLSHKGKLKKKRNQKLR